MNTFKKLLSVFLAIALVFSMAAVMTACDDEGGEDSTTGTQGNNTEKRTYSVNVRTIGGMALEGIEVYIYVDSDLKDAGETNADGSVSFELPVNSNYSVQLTGVPEGYEVQESYSFNGSTADIVLTSRLIEGESLSGAALGLGDVMYDFSVVTSAGETVTLSEMLAEKDMVMLNFWFSTCGPCANEFPYMEQAYQMYQEDVGIIALDPLENDATVASYQQSMGLSFPMAACQPAWSSTFGISGYPTSIVIDRYGVICLIEVGGLTSLRPFTSMFEHFTAEDYEQKLCQNGVSDLITAVKPTYTMPTSDEIGAAINSGDIEVTYHPETDEGSADLTWPFILTEKKGETCLKASNQGIEDSYAILYADVTLKAGQALGFDYLVSSEQGMDVMVVIVDGEDIYQMSGVSEQEAWSSCYPWVAEEDGTYEVALCYLKDEADNAGDDTVYIKNMRVIDAADIDTATFIPRFAASTEDGFAYTYVDIVYNEKDNYYHVGTADGPLLLANLMGYTQFSEEETLWDIVYNGDADVDGRVIYDEMVDFFSYASNSNLNGYCTVTKELAELLKVIDSAVGFDEEDENEWLRVCSFYQAYGNGNTQLEDPIKGLAPFAAYTATLGTNVDTNYFYYNRVIMPRGLLAEFVPSRSGVYRITSSNESSNGVDGWIFDENRQELLVYEQDERLYSDSSEVSMVFYMEAGKSYYIDIAFWDPYEVGYIYYDIEYVASELEHFRLCSPGYFTYDSDATGDAMYYLIAGGIKAVLGSDGVYYEDLGKDANGTQLYGSKIYADFTGITTLFSSPISTVNAYNEDGTIKRDEDGSPVMVKGMIELGGFDFSKTENDLYIIGFLDQNNNDVDATKTYLKTLWGTDYDAYAKEYQIEDVFAGRYHGKGEDLTAEISTYLDDVITGGSEERVGCVVVTERLAEILQLLMDKYTFANVDQSWLKLCYYYDYLGPEG